MKDRMNLWMSVVLGVFLCFGMFASEVSAQELGDVNRLAAEDEGAKAATPNIGSSVDLIVKAWEALGKNDLQSVLDITEECINRYGKRALQMQQKLDGFVQGSFGEIRSHWALNDVATALFIQGKALQKSGRIDEARAAYEDLINKYGYGQCWDPKGWFWKPAEVAKEYLEMIPAGVFYDFGDYSSEALVLQAWKALEQEDLGAVLAFTGKCIDLYSPQARQMQSELSDYPKGSSEDIFQYWALNDVATAYFIRARAYMIEGDKESAVRAFKIIRDEFSFGQCWDPKGWFWKPNDEAENWMNILIPKTDGPSE